MTTYMIVRHFRDSRRRFIIKRGLTLEAAQAHCQDPETSSTTATSTLGRQRTRRSGPWFDGYAKERQ
jgi:hypothetical protein